VILVQPIGGSTPQLIASSHYVCEWLAVSVADVLLHVPVLLQVFASIVVVVPGGGRTRAVNAEP